MAGPILKQIFLGTLGSLIACASVLFTALPATHAQTQVSPSATSQYIHQGEYFFVSAPFSLPTLAAAQYTSAVLLAVQCSPQLLLHKSCMVHTPGPFTGLRPADVE